MIKYEGDVYRPPSEAYSLLIQVTIGCSWNKCAFCGMYRTERFRIRTMDEIKADLFEARRMYSRVRRIFLCDGDALCLSNDKLCQILDMIAELFPECERVGIYASSKDILAKTHEELVELREKNLGIAYIGAESGNPEVLKYINKGVTREEIIESVHMVENAGIKASVTFLAGIGGRAHMKEHAVDTGTMITEMNASYVGVLTIIPVPTSELFEDVRAGRFQVLTPEEAVMETHMMLENMNPSRECVFRSNHASNYVNLRGVLPQDRDRMLAQLEWAMDHQSSSFKPERFRGL